MRRLVPALLTVVLLALPAFAASPAPDAAPLIARMQTAYAAMGSLSGVFTQELRHAESGAVEQRQGTLLFQKPLRVRWKTEPPFPEELIVNDTCVWDYLPDENVVYRHPVEVMKDSRTMLQVITGQSRLDRDFTVEREADQNGLAALRLYPKEPTTQMVEALLLLDPRTSLLHTAEIIDFYGNSNRLMFTTLTPDAPVPNGSFHFTPPKGVAVESGATEGERRQ